MLDQREEENIHSCEALLNRRVHHTTSPELNETSAPLPRESVGGKGMILQQMQRMGLSVSEFQCVTTEMAEVIEQQSLESHSLALYIPGITNELAQLTSLADIKARIKALPAANQDKRVDWLGGGGGTVRYH